jgi:hypothetical protein
VNDPVSLVFSLGCSLGAQSKHLANIAPTYRLPKSAPIFEIERVGEIAGRAGLGLYPSSSVNALRLKNQLIAQEIAGGHAFGKHILIQGEFPGWIRTRKQFEQHVLRILNNPDELAKVGNHKVLFWEHHSGTVVIRNKLATDGGTAFQPEKWF